METKPDTIHVSALAKEEINATHANLFVTVRGSSVISGNEALKKAKEVSALVDELTRAGVAAEDVHLQGVYAETSSGVLLKSSSAAYRLRVRCGKLESLPELLDIVASQKNAALERIDWKYDEASARERGLASAMEAAKSKAEKVAAALGVKL
ncbi:MAG: SIMPL domain-containing protein, partial [Anaerolineae bacterium]|nr:SIMPL domain-containing protein [Anaerolineae bacterium]